VRFITVLKAHFGAFSTQRISLPLRVRAGRNGSLSPSRHGSQDAGLSRPANKHRLHSGGSGVASPGTRMLLYGAMPGQPLTG